MQNQKGVSMLLILMIVAVVALIFLAAFFLIWQNIDFNGTVQNPGAGNQTQTDSIASWQTYTDSQYSFEFKYPADFGSKYASFQSIPMAIITTDTSKIDANGCLAAPAYSPKESQVTINNMQFCLATTSDPGAGQLYNTYNYTTLKNGNYITLQYVVHTLNGCSPYMDTPDYQPCTDFMNNYDNAVVKTIEKSVSTLRFIK